MKKVIFILSVCVIALTSSCKKSFQCDCVTTDKNGDYIKTESNKYKEKEREDAQAACTAKSDVTPSITKKCTIIN